MKTKKFALNRGLVKTIVLIIALVLLLAYLGFNLREILASETFISIWNFIKHWSAVIWNDYIIVYGGYLWSKIFLPYIVEPFISFFK